MKKTFTYQFDEDQRDSLSYEVSLEENERLDTRVEDGAPIIFMNRPAMLTFAKILIKLAEGSYSERFHLHLKKDFGEGPDALTIVLYPDDAISPNTNQSA